jgi:hypothetical protein
MQSVLPSMRKGPFAKQASYPKRYESEEDEYCCQTSNECKDNAISSQMQMQRMLGIKVLKVYEQEQ